MKNLRILLDLIGPVINGARAFSGIRDAKRDNDKLALANGLACVLVAVTGGALAVRDLRRGGK